MDMSRPDVEIEHLLLPTEVAAMFGVDVATVARWARRGRLPAVRTPGGHRRFRERDVRPLLPTATGPFRQAV